MKERINSPSDQATIYILTADTQGIANKEISGMNAELMMNADLIRIPGEDSKQVKLEFSKTLDLEVTVAIGNGSNDQLILKEAALGIAVLGDEGVSASAVKSADVIVKNIQNALDLLLKPKRLIATLRE